MRTKLTLTLLLVLLLSACQQESTESTQTLRHSEKKVYRHSEDDRPNSLDPIKASTVYSNLLVVNIFDTLYAYKYLERPYALKPNLAVDMPSISENGLVYTIKIKPEVRFTDHLAFTNGQGREVKAQDFVYSIMRSFDPNNGGTGAWLWQGKIVGIDDWREAGADYDAPIPGLLALDDYTIQIKLTEPYPQLTYTLAMGFSAITPREVVEHLGQEFGSKPVGSGPFKLTSFNSDTAYLAKNPNFRAEPLDLAYEGYDPELHSKYGIQKLSGKAPPFIDELEVHFIKETSSRWHSFTKGNEIHYTTVPKDKQSAVILQQEPLQLHPQITDQYHYTYGLEAGFVYHGFNMQDPDFGISGDEVQNQKNHALRCAIRKAHNWSQKNRAFYFGLGQVFPGIIPPSVPEFDPSMSTDSVEVDIEAARTLLSDYGWTADNLPLFEYHVSGSVLQKQFFEQMRGFMHAIGYPANKIKYQPYPNFGQFNKAVKNRQAPFFFMGWTLDYPDAENTLQLFYGPNETPGQNNFNYHNPKFDALFEQSRILQPSTERTALYREMNQMVVDDCVVISGLSRNKIHLWHKNVITFPDREIVGGFHLRYVDIIPE
ncbi:MAG: ABC transporter substrate-binding protein [Marinicella sp.]